MTRKKNFLKIVQKFSSNPATGLTKGRQTRPKASDLPFLKEGD